MAITYPYALSVLADRLDIESETWDIKRNDELSRTGDGRVWQAELAPPLWTADVTLNIGPNNNLKQIAACVCKLHGAQELFHPFVPLSKYPQADPDGSILVASPVRINSVGTGGRTISLKGLPGGLCPDPRRQDADRLCDVTRSECLHRGVRRSHDGTRLRGVEGLKNAIEMVRINAWP